MKTHTSDQPPKKTLEKEERTASQSLSTNTPVRQACVKDVMARRTSNVVHTIRPQQTLHEAVERLRDHGIGALVVTNADNAVIGILSERDIVRKLADAPGRTLPHRVDEVMTREVESCTENELLLRVLKRMSMGKFRHMPVVEGAALVGLVTIGDLVQYRLDQLELEALQMKQLMVG